MLNLTNRWRTSSVLAAMIVCLPILAGCGSDDSSSAAPVAVSGGAEVPPTRPTPLPLAA